MSDTKLIKRLMYLRKSLDERIDEYITEYLLRGKYIESEKIKDSLTYCMDDNLDAYKNCR